MKLWKIALAAVPAVLIAAGFVNWATQVIEDEQDSVISIGDKIQWEIGGVYQFAEPQEVTDIKIHDGQAFVFVDNELTGIPIDQVKKA